MRAAALNPHGAGLIAFAGVALLLSPAIPAGSQLQLINVLLKEGKRAEAIGQLQGFLSAFPTSPFRPQAEQLLHRLEMPAAGQGGPS